MKKKLFDFIHSPGYITSCDLYNMWNERDPEVVRDMLRQPYCTLDYTNMGAEKEYQKVRDIFPKDMTIIDFGGGMAAQCIYFEDYETYICVDPVKEYNPDSSHELKRFALKNTIHYEDFAQNFIQKTLPALHYDLNKICAVMINVPDEDAMNMIKETFPNYYLAFPGREVECAMNIHILEEIQAR